MSDGSVSRVAVEDLLSELGCEDDPVEVKVGNSSGQVCVSFSSEVSSLTLDGAGARRIASALLIAADRNDN